VELYLRPPISLHGVVLSYSIGTIHLPLPFYIQKLKFGCEFHRKVGQNKPATQFPTGGLITLCNFCKESMKWIKFITVFTFYKQINLLIESTLIQLLVSLF